MGTKINATVTGAVRAEAARRGITQLELARTAGLTQTTMCRRYANASPWRVDELVAVASVFGVPVSLLIGCDQ